MAAIITEKFRQSNADTFSADIASSKYYMFVGKSQPWTSEGAASDSLPPATVDSVAPESYFWDDMLAGKLNPTSNTTTDELYEYITQKTTEESSEICDDSTESAGKRQSSGK